MKNIRDAIGGFSSVIGVAERRNSMMKTMVKMIWLGIYCLSLAFSQRTDAQPVFQAASIDSAPLGNRIPLILIHGIQSDPSMWNTFLNYYATHSALQNNFKPYTFGYKTDDTVMGAADPNDIFGLCPKLGTFLQQSFGNQKVAILAHSMGGLVTRAMMEYYTYPDGTRGGDRVLALITLATPHHGTPAANEYIASYPFVPWFAAGVHQPYWLHPGFAYNMEWDCFNGVSIDNYCATGIPSSADYSKIIAYGGQITSWGAIPSQDAELVAPYLIVLDNYGYNNDGAVPIQSALFQNASGVRTRQVDGSCDHFQIYSGQSTVNGGTPIFDSITADLQSVVPISLPEAPVVTTVSPASFTGLPIGQTKLIRVIGSGFTGSSTLTFNDGVNPPYTGRMPSSWSANELDYNVTTGTNQANWTVQVVNGAQTSNLGYFTVNAPSTPPAATGSLVVNLSPAGAISAGAQWQVDGTGYNSSGQVVGYLTPGSHTVSFKPISGYSTPANQIVTINANAQTTASGTYTVNAPSPTGSITVNITPSGAVSAGAQWRVDNGSYLNNGDVAVGLSPGSHTVSLKSVSGYNTPTNLVLSVVANQQITVNAIYAAIANCSYSLSAYSDIWAAAGGSGAFNVIAPAGCTWTASEDLSWVTITSGSSGSGTHGVFYQVDYNPSISPRSGVITTDGGSFTINQNGNAGACTFTLSAPGANVPAAGGTNSYSVYTGSICFWSISRNANWITLISQQDHTGSDSVQYTVQPYFGSLPRSAAILLSADGGQTFVATFTITQAGTPPPPGTLATGLSSPRSIAVDDNYVFWSEPSVLKRVSKTGAGETAVATSSFYGFGQMVLDGNYLYYLDSGTKVQKLLKSGGTPTTLATGSSFYDAITVQNNAVFWGVPSGLIYSVSTAGGSVTTVATGSQDIASIRVTNNTVVWSQTTYPAVVFAQPIGGSRITLSSGVNVEPGLAIQDGFAYFTGSESIYRVPIGGGTRQTLASNLNDAYDLALDATNIYWVEAGNPLGTNGSVRQMPLSGGPIITLATNLAQPVAITVDSTNVYWLENNNGSTTRSALRWAAKASTVADVVSPSISITNPSDGAQFNESMLSVNGTAADNISVALVELQLNGGAWQTATGTTVWTGSVNLVSGTNAIQARSRDSAGNYSTIASILVTYSPPDTRLPQTITFGALSDQVFGDAPFALSATSSSGLPVYLNVLSGPAALDTNNVLTLLGAGTVTAIAWQPGNSNYNAAVPVQQSFNVSKSPQTITFGALSQQKVGDAPFSLNATADSGLPVSFSIVSGPATLSGNILVLNGWGTVTVIASQAGNNSYAAATSVPQSFFVTPPDKTIVSPQRLPNGSFQLAFYGTAGQAYTLQASSNLVGWVSVLTFVCTNSPTYVVDPGAKYLGRRFYRVAQGALPIVLRMNVGAPPVLSSNGLGLSLDAPLGFAYTIQAATNMVDWQTLTNVLTTNSPVYFRDAGAVNYGRRFYRAKGQ